MVEPNNPYPRKISGVTLIACLILLGLLAAGWYVWSGSAARSDTLLAATPSPSPIPGEALRELRATEESLLTTYGWSDRQRGIVHIPIDRAIDLTLQRGLPVRLDDEQPIQEF